MHVKFTSSTVVDLPQRGGGVTGYPHPVVILTLVVVLYTVIMGVESYVT